ncbi:dihydrolipoyl dehydrogenase [Calycomorphotria hydatis]|uniref:Dihydrolipoyl dehydrogenase n=1 Tax=Calycomorphotria hydatis TaxID=2528027 RepID=A0A517TDW3_9PLAN|nr:dihydrolipoyl dehydrogenase [Calycomorphotria hydatis]QDT66552.1 Dihydrolipoyl dehydrogenase 3 [Calycomorphotria hydatis]
MPQHDLVVIGGGPGGYVAAIRASQLGLNTACIEFEKPLGGTCLRVGCIPSKALLESSELFAAARHQFADRGIEFEGLTLDLGKMMGNKDKTVKALTGGIDSLFKKNKVTRYVGFGRLDGRADDGSVCVCVDDADGNTTELTATHVLIATGSTPATLPGIDIDGEFVVTSTEALTFTDVPEHMVVIGGGVIGLELGAVWSRLGAHVTVLEYLDRILPGADGEIAAEAEKIFRKQGLDIHTGKKVTGVDREARTVLVEGLEPIPCDKVLMSVGRRPYTDNLGLETVGIESGPRGFVPVDEQYRTAAQGVYAVGDVIGGAMLAHKAEEEGIACVERIATGHGHINYDAIPSIVYTSPEIGSVGKTEEELQEAGIKYRKGVFPFIANGRARAIGHTDGKVKILADAETDRVVGVHIVGPHAGDLIAECSVAMDFGASAEDIARSCHAHPTLSETVKEAALAVDGRALHY